VCQVSTTLYNAVLQCGLKVTERHEHSDDVYYVPDGKDATVTYGGADFKFVNTRRSPVMIRVSVGRKALTVQIYENAAIG
jgi:vancomycin resistance protein YoaR